MDLATFGTFTVASVALILTPGPDILYVLTCSLARGRRAGLAAAMGFASGLPVHTALTAVGAGVILRQSPLAFNGLKYAGAAYLFYLAVRAFSAPSAPPSGPPSGPPSVAPSIPAAVPAVGGVAGWSLRGVYGQCIFMNLLNPKVALFFLAFLPQFVPTDAGGWGWRIGLLGALFLVYTVICFGAVALSAGGIGNYMQRRPAAAKVMNYLTAAVLFGLAVRLVLLQFEP